MLRVSSCGVALLAAAIAAVTGGCSSSSPPISLSLAASPQPTIDQTQTVGITATVTNDKPQGGVSWSLSGPGSLSNTTSLSVTYNSPATNSTSAQVATVTATSIADRTKSASLQVTVNPSPEIPNQTLPNGSVGVPYSQMITLTGGTAPFQWSVYNGPIVTGWKVGGAVPDGLQLDPNTGLISGTPSAGGTWYFEATATDAAGVTAVNGFLTLQIASAAAPENPVPFLNQPLVPAAVSPGSPGFTLSVSGVGFISGAKIEFNGAPLATTFLDSQHLTAAVTGTNVATAGTATITVLNPAPGGGQSNVAYFQVAAPQTAISFVNAPISPFPAYSATAVVASDFNGDGKVDLAFTAYTTVYVLLGNGDGTFGAAPDSPMQVASPPYDDFASPHLGPLAVGDFNHSGHLGLAVGEPQNMAAVILLGNGNGTFSPSSAVFADSLGTPVSAMAPADFDGDGNLDLAFVNQLVGHQGPVELGYGSGAFTAVGDLNTLQFPVGVALGDFNGDGKLDAVVANGGSTAYPNSGLTVSLGRGDGTFTSGPSSPIHLGKNLWAIIAADFNGDGKLDLAVTDAGANSAMILLGNGDGTFGAPATNIVGNQPFAMAAGDFNNDGKLDLVVANNGDNTITLLLGNGDGTFTQATGSPYAAGKGPFSIAAADFNGDGKLDLAVANLTDGTVSILLQQ